MKKITNYLVDLGLTEVEADIYQGLLQTGPTTVKELSEHLHMKRITTHFNVESLIEKGLIVQTMHGARRKIMAETPSKLEYLVEQKTKNVFNLKSDLGGVITQLNNLSINAKSAHNVEIKYYEGKKAVQNIYLDTLKANEFRAYVNCRELARVFPKNVDLFISTHKKYKNMHVWEIMEPSEDAKKYINKMPKERYYYQFIPSGLNLSVIDYMIYDGKVAIVNLEEKTTGIIITNSHYYQNAKAIYDFVWQMLRISSK